MRDRVLVACMVALAPLGAQAPAASSLPARIVGEPRRQLERLVDSARAVRLPVEPLEARAAEGVLKGANDQRIVAAVRNLLARLIEARGLLRDGAGAAALTAAVSALDAGVSPQSIKRLVNASSARYDVSFALVALTDLATTAGVPPEGAAGVVEGLVRRGASQTQLEAFRADVVRDIQSGASPAAAVTSRAEAVMRAMDAANQLPDKRRPPAAPDAHSPRAATASAPMRVRV